MKKVIALIMHLFGILTFNSYTATNITNLQTPDLDETSGLLFYNNNIITHNDSGGKPYLYEINELTGTIKRTVEIANATNVDWEDLTQDAHFIYIGDIGNNAGNRTDLKIYKISKTDYNDGDDKVTAEIISYSYANQLDFTTNSNNTNWDAESLISYGDKLLIFSKNWIDHKVNVYAIPKTSGKHSAILVSSFNAKGLITSADISIDEKLIYITGYSNSEAPFMYTIQNIPANSLDIFSGITSKKIKNIAALGNQVEAIAVFEMTPTKHRLYITNEKYVAPFLGGFIKIPTGAKLRLIEIETGTPKLPEKDNSLKP